MKRTVFAALLLLFPLCLGAQQSEDYRMYAANNGASMLLLRGRQGMEFPLPHNGTHFWYTPQFRSGTLYYNSKLYENVLLNIDAFNQELLVRDPNGITNILLSRNYVKWFDIEGRKYVNLQAMGFGDAPEGYFQLMYDGRSKLYFRIDKALIDRMFHIRIRNLCIKHSIICSYKRMNHTLRMNYNFNFISNNIK